MATTGTWNNYGGESVVADGLGLNVFSKWLNSNAKKLSYGEYFFSKRIYFILNRNTSIKG